MGAKFVPAMAALEALVNEGSGMQAKDLLESINTAESTRASPMQPVTLDPAVHDSCLAASSLASDEEESPDLPGTRKEQMTTVGEDCVADTVPSATLAYSSEHGYTSPFVKLPSVLRNDVEPATARTLCMHFEAEAELLRLGHARRSLGTRAVTRVRGAAANVIWHLRRSFAPSASRTKDSAAAVMRADMRSQSELKKLAAKATNSKRDEFS